MGYIVRFIRYYVREIKIRFFKYSPTYYWEIDKKPSLITRLIQNILGYLYYTYKKYQEIIRVRSFNIKADFAQNKIFTEILQYSTKLLFYLFLLILLSLFLDWSLFNYLGSTKISWPSTHLAEIILGAIVASVSAILGLLFALYSVGFLLTTDKYSHKVTEYMDGEKFGNYYFKLLIFTDLYSLIILCIVLLTGKFTIVSFIVSFTLFITSLVGIIVFKNSYLLSLKPLSIYRRLTFDILELFQNINCYDKPKISSFKLTNDNKIKSFKLYLSFLDSWSIVKSSQTITKKLLDISKTLYRDLSKSGKYDDAYYGLSFSSNILQKYLSIKRYVDTTNSWWFPEQYEYVKASNNLMYVIKANYEIKGVGPLYIQKPNLTWIEDDVIAFFNEVQDSLSIRKNKLITAGLIDAYSLILAGDSKKNKEGHFVKTDYGAFEQQELSIYDSVIENFFKLYDYIKDDNSLYIDYLNALFQTSLVIIEGYKTSEFDPFIKKLISKSGKLGLAREAVKSVQLPKIALEIFQDYWERLNVEQIAEGRIITPLEWIEDSIKKDYEAKTSGVVNENIKKVVEHTDLILKDLYSKKDFTHLAQIVKVRYEWISRLLYLSKTALAEQTSQLIKSNVIYLLQLPEDVIEESELREQIEKGLLPALVERNKVIYKFYLSAFLLTLAYLINKTQNPQDKILLMRVPLVVGSLAYLISEFDMDNFYVLEFISQTETFLFKRELIAEIFERVDEVEKFLDNGERFRLIENESTRFRTYYRIIINAIQELPEDWVHESPNAIGYGRRLKHPSMLIQRIGEFQFYDMDQANEDFVDWIKRREIIKKIIYILNHIPNDKIK